VIGVSVEIRDMIAGLTRDRIKPEVIPAYLPPSSEEYSATLPPDIINFCQSLSIIICAVASKPAQRGGRDIYGFETCIRAFEMIAAEKRNCGLLLVVGGNQRSEYYTGLQASIQQSRFGERIHLHTGSVAFPALTRHCTLFLRPTLTDGDSVSVREALDSGVPVIASDCVKRPSGVRLFATDDVSDLAKRVKEALDRAPDSMDLRLSADHMNYADRLIEILANDIR
jgi:glycosyltransferase involved in cell wall biosynthesis